MSATADIAARLAEARRLAAAGDDAAAKAAYLEILQRDPAQFDALNELGTLAYESGHRSAARTAYEQAVRRHPGKAMARVNLANLLVEAGELDAAQAHYAAALVGDPDFAEAHQGLARLLSELGEDEAAAPHFEKGFAGRAVVTKRRRGQGPGVPLLLLVSAKGGNIPTERWLDDRLFAITALYAEFFDPAQPLPPHAILFNAIGDADRCGEALAHADAIVARSTAPIVNRPEAVRATGRAANARRLAGIPGLVVPAVASLSRPALLTSRDLRFPLLLRTPGFHTGQHFLRIEGREEIAAALARLPGDAVLAIEYLDARGRDGLARKYRVMMIDGALYPLHLAISDDWKVHYFTADMAASTAHRAEERRFLEDMPAVLGGRAMAALREVCRVLALDYGGIDFGLAPDGSVLLFEANATMVVNPPEPDPIWDYRRPAIERVLDAAKRMVRARAKL
ncbi:MAG TPA: tetratricopeptide repeat protein [Stellaceae bacterium]|nr:tetratricopeptide repeat protein [Stellaceae bacterium]